VSITHIAQNTTITSGSNYSPTTVANILTASFRTASSNPSGGGATTWTLGAGGGGGNQEQWWGAVTATGAHAFNFAGTLQSLDEFSNGSTATLWSVDKNGITHTGASGSTFAGPTLTPTGSGELAVYNFEALSVSSGGTSGFTYEAGATSIDEIAYDLNVGAAVTPSVNVGTSGFGAACAGVLYSALVGTDASAGLAAATVAAYGPSETVAPTARVAGVTATALSAAPDVQPVASVAAVIAAAYNASVVTGDFAPAGTAPVSVAALLASAKVGSGAGLANVAATAYNASIWPYSQLPVFSVQVAQNNNPFDPPSAMVWSEQRDWVRKIRVQIGKTGSLDRVNASTASITFNNRYDPVTGIGGRFTPSNTNSPLYNANPFYGLVPEKPIRVVASFGGISYPIFYGFVDSWGPSILGQWNQDAVLAASDILSLLNTRYLANTTLYPNTVLASVPNCYARCGDFQTPIAGASQVTLQDSSGYGSVLLVPGLAAASGSNWTGGQGGPFLYDPNTALALGDSSALSTAISAVQSALAQANSNQSAVSSASGAESAALSTASSALSALSSAVSTASADNSSASSVFITAALPYSAGYNAVLSAISLTTSFISGGTQAEASAAIAAWNAGQSGWTNSAGQALTVTTGSSTAPNNLAASYANSVAADCANVASLVASAMAALAAYTQAQAAYGTAAGASAIAGEAYTAALAAIPESGAYIALSTSAGGMFSGDLWFATTTLPTSGYWTQTVASVSGNSSAVGAFQINTTGQLCFNWGTPGGSLATEIASSAVVTDGNFHHLSWSMSGHGGTIIVELDGVTLGSFSNANLSRGISGSIYVGGLWKNPAVVCDFIGTVSDIATYSTQIAISVMDNHDTVGTYFQNVETTDQRLLKVLDVALGPAVVANLTLDFDAGTQLCAPETNPTIQTQGLSYAQSVSDTEAGLLHVGGDGAIHFWNRRHPTTGSRSTTSQGIVGDNLSTATYHYLADLQIVRQNRNLFTDIQAMISTGASSATAAGTPTATTPPQLQEAINTAAQGPIGPRVLQRSGLLYASEQGAADLATLYELRYSVPVDEVAVMSLSSLAANQVNLPIMLGSKLWDRLTVQRQGPGESGFSGDQLAIKIDHQMDIDTTEWKTTFALSPYELIPAQADVANVAATAYNAHVSTNTPTAGVAQVQAAALNPTAVP